MPKAKEILKKVWLNRTARNLTILLILILTLIIVLIINLRPPEPRKSERVLICDKCKYTYMFDFVTIKGLKCPKCKNGRMRYGMKCQKCDYEFPYIDSPLTEEQKKDLSKLRKQRIMDHRCPNCGAIDVRPISNFLWRKKHHK